jgi:hypothetical protein
MRIFRRYELCSREPSGSTEHVSWHMFRRTAHRARWIWMDRLYQNDGSRDGSTYFTVRKVED